MVKRVTGIIILCFIFSSVSVASLHAQLLDKPIATVHLEKLENISLRSFRKKAEQLELQLSRKLTLKDREELLELEIGKVLILQAGARDHLRPTQEELNQSIAQIKQNLGANISESEFRRLITEQSGMSYSVYEQELKDKLAIDKYVMYNKKDKLTSLELPNSAEIQSFYEENATRFTNPLLVRFTHLYFDTRKASSTERRKIKEFANKKLSSIRSKKKTFDTLLDESLDDASFSGGDFGYLARTEPRAEQMLGKKFVEVVFSLGVGDISEVLESNVGYHIIKITNKRQAKLLAIGDPIFPGEDTTVREYIKEHLTQLKQAELMSEATQEVIDELLKKAEVQRFIENLNW